MGKIEDGRWGRLQVVTVMCHPPLANSGGDGDNTKSADGISAVQQIGSLHTSSHRHHPSSPMKYNGENGQ